MTTVGPPIPMTRSGSCVRATGLLLATIEADAAVVLMVSVAITAVTPVIVGGAVTEHVGVSTAPMGLPVTAQLRATLPVNPPLGLIVMVDVAFVPGDAMVTAVPLSLKPGRGAGTLTVNLVVALTLPAEAPMTLTVYEPGLVAGCVFRVSVVVTVEPATAIGEGIAHDGGLTAPDGPPVTAQLMVTCPL